MQSEKTEHQNQSWGTHHPDTKTSNCTPYISKTSTLVHHSVYQTKTHKSPSLHRTEYPYATLHSRTLQIWNPFHLQSLRQWSTCFARFSGKLSSKCHLLTSDAGYSTAYFWTCLANAQLSLRSVQMTGSKKARQSPLLLVWVHSYLVWLRLGAPFISVVWQIAYAQEASTALSFRHGLGYWGAPNIHQACLYLSRLLSYQKMASM